jgi:hypothetical protein
MPHPGSHGRLQGKHERGRMAMMKCYAHICGGDPETKTAQANIDTEANLSLDWAEEETQLPGGNAHLWEESWDDDDTNEEFAVQLR